MDTPRSFTHAVVVAAVAALILSPVSTAARTADGPFILRHPALGAFAAFGTCPDVELPPAGTVCVDTGIGFGATSRVEGGGSLAPKYADWYVDVETAMLEFTGADEPIVTVLRRGFAHLGEIDAEVAIDTVHLQTASADFVLPMSDGSAFDFAGTWTAVADRIVFGVDGPATGLPRHYNDACVTVNALGHQKIRFAEMSGTLNGQTVHSYTANPFAAVMWDNSFQYITVPHDDCQGAP